MALQRPTSQDVEKLHAEVNQIVNQRLLLVTLAVTIFGVMIAWLIPRNTPIEQEPLGQFVYITSILITILLFALFLLSHHLTYMLRVFTTYLDETDTSNWEKDWFSYREKFKYFGYTKPQSLIFLLLGILSSVFPVILVAAYPFNYELNFSAIVNTVVGLLYIVFVAGMGFGGWFAKEGEIKRKWSELNQ